MIKEATTVVFLVFAGKAEAPVPMPTNERPAVEGEIVIRAGEWEPCVYPKCARAR